MSTGGMKYDQGKLRMGLVFNQFRNALSGVAKVLTYGAMKYPDPETGDRSWRNVPGALERYSDAFDRHMDLVRFQIENYQTSTACVDEETGQLHIDHAITNLLFLRTLLYGDAIDYAIKPIQAKQESSPVSKTSPFYYGKEAKIPSTPLD